MRITVLVSIVYIQCSTNPCTTLSRDNIQVLLKNTTNYEISTSQDNETCKYTHCNIHENMKWFSVQCVSVISVFFLNYSVYIATVDPEIIEISDQSFVVLVAWCIHTGVA